MLTGSEVHWNIGTYFGRSRIKIKEDFICQSFARYKKKLNSLPTQKKKNYISGLNDLYVACEIFGELTRCVQPDLILAVNLSHLK